jgi:hypothetical protein
MFARIIRTTLAELAGRPMRAGSKASRMIKPFEQFADGIDLKHFDILGLPYRQQRVAFVNASADN